MAPEAPDKLWLRPVPKPGFSPVVVLIVRWIAKYSVTDARCQWCPERNFAARHAKTEQKTVALHVPGETPATSLKDSTFC